MGQQALEARSVAVVITDLPTVRRSKTISRLTSTSTEEECDLIQNNDVQEELQKQVQSKHNKVLVNMVAGALAGGIAKTTIAPLDRTKIYFQVTMQRYSGAGVKRFLLESYHKHGFISLWRGNSATMARIIPYAAVQFASHEQWKAVLKIDQADSTTPSYLRFVAGSLAGVTSQLLTYPLDLARARMAVTPKNTYSSLSQVFVKIWKHEGLLTLYRGLTPTLVGVIPYAGTSFGIYETLKNYHKEITKLENPNPMYRMLFGGVAGLLGQTASYPLDIVRRRMQTASVTGNNNSYQTIIGTISKVYREEGLARGLYKGLSLNFVKGPIATGISFATFDSLKQLLEGFPGPGKSKIEESKTK